MSDDLRARIAAVVHQGGRAVRPLANAVGAVCDRCGATFLALKTPRSCLCDHCFLGMLSRHQRDRIITRTATGERL